MPLSWYKYLIPFIHLFLGNIWCSRHPLLKHDFNLIYKNAVMRLLKKTARQWTLSYSCYISELSLKISQPADLQATMISLKRSCSSMLDHFSSCIAPKKNKIFSVAQLCILWTSVTQTWCINRMAKTKAIKETCLKT